MAMIKLFSHTQKKKYIPLISLLDATYFFIPTLIIGMPGIFRILLLSALSQVATI